MPIYEYKCTACGRECEELSARYEPKSGRACPTVFAPETQFSYLCEGVVLLKVSLPAEQCATLGYPYVDENISHNPVKVESRAHRKQLLKQNGLSDIGPAMRFGCV